MPIWDKKDREAKKTRSRSKDETTMDLLQDEEFQADAKNLKHTPMSAAEFQALVAEHGPEKATQMIQEELVRMNPEFFEKHKKK